MESAVTADDSHALVGNAQFGGHCSRQSKPERPADIRAQEAIGGIGLGEDAGVLFVQTNVTAQDAPASQGVAKCFHDSADVCSGPVAHCRRPAIQKRLGARLPLGEAETTGPTVQTGYRRVKVSDTQTSRSEG